MGRFERLAEVIMLSLRIFCSSRLRTPSPFLPSHDFSTLVSSTLRLPPTPSPIRSRRGKDIVSDILHRRDGGIDFGLDIQGIVFFEIRKGAPEDLFFPDLDPGPPPMEIRWTGLAYFPESRSFPGLSAMSWSTHQPSIPWLASVRKRDLLSR
jgi:hypothetical protein